MRFTATVTFTSQYGKQGRRQFMIDERFDGPAYAAAVRGGIALASRVGGYGVNVVNIKPWA